MFVELFRSGSRKLQTLWKARQRIIVVCCSFLALLLLSFLSGCSSKAVEDCGSLSCIKQAHRVEIAEACHEDLINHSWAGRKEREATNRKYRYPYSNADTYAQLVRWGHGIPSPAAWCRAYAKAMVR